MIRFFVLRRCLGLVLLSLASAVAAQPDPLAAGRLSFEVRCAGCHGADGRGGERAPGIGQVDRNRLKTDKSVRDLIRGGIAGSGMPGFDIPDAELGPLVAFVRKNSSPAREAPMTGDVRAGEAFFFGAGGCAGCHMMQGRGALSGPDLTRAGAELTLAELEQSLEAPNSRRMPGYAVASITLASGESVRGFIKNESGSDLQMQGFDDRLHLLRKTQIRQITREADSLMPPVHAATDQLRDLLAFLAHGTEPRVPPAETTALPDALTWERVIHSRPGEWPTYNGDIGGNRYSALSEITPANVSRLALKWIFPVKGGKNLEVTPVVVGGVMYVTSANTVVALDARSGRKIWRFSLPRHEGLVGDAAGGINRGVGLLGDRVFIVTDNAHLLALHRLTGALLWDIEMADSNEHYGSTSAPLIVGDLVVAGVSGGDEGIRGFVAAFRPSNGERAWQFWTVPRPGEPLADTWVGRAIEHGCASTWLTGTYDGETDTLFWPTGNPCPDFNGDERKGDNLYSDSVLALDPRTGGLKWYYQFTPHDLHDWDATETPMVVDAVYHGRQRKLLLQGKRNGFFYVLDRSNGEFLGASAFVNKLTWAKSIGTDGRPILAETGEPTVHGTKVCPSLEGASNWMSTSYNPGTGLFYVMALEKCTNFSKNTVWWRHGESFYGGAASNSEDVIPRKYLRALDPQTGKIRWEYEQTGPSESWSGVLSTASGLIFFGDDDGAFAAVDATSGKPLWRFSLNEESHASPMTYMLDGHQYIAQAVGPNIVVFGLN